MRTPFQTIERMCSGMKVTMEERHLALCAMRRISLCFEAGSFPGYSGESQAFAMDSLAALFDAELNSTTPVRKQEV